MARSLVLILKRIQRFERVTVLVSLKKGENVDSLSEAKKRRMTYTLIMVLSGVAHSQITIWSWVTMCVFSLGG